MTWELAEKIEESKQALKLGPMAMFTDEHNEHHPKKKKNLDHYSNLKTCNFDLYNMHSQYQ